MKLVLTGRHVSVPATARAEIDRRLGRLERVLGDALVSAQCVVDRERTDYTCEITVHARGDHRLRGSGRHARLVTAVGEAAQKVQQQARRLADRWKHRRKPQRGVDRRRPGGPVTEVAAEPAPQGPRVIRQRPAAVKPMTLDDAVLALEAGREAFVVFRHAPGETVAVLYRRADGHYGLVDPGE